LIAALYSRSTKAIAGGINIILSNHWIVTLKQSSRTTTISTG